MLSLPLGRRIQLGTNINTKERANLKIDSSVLVEVEEAGRGTRLSG